MKSLVTTEKRLGEAAELHREVKADATELGRMKVIFLDIDGVLNCTRTPNPRKFPYIVDPTLLARFNRILEKTGAHVVLSSTWRYGPAELFSAKHWGVPFIDMTPDLPHVPRCKEIIGWLERHSEVDRFAVIDDEDDGLDELPLFQPSARTGLTDEIVNGVTDYLNGRTDRDMRRGRATRIVQNIWATLRQHPG